MSRNPNLIANYAIRNQTKSPGVRQQIEQYKNSTSNTTIDFNRTLYIIWSGTNNYYFNKTLTTSDTVQSIFDCLDLLITFGGQNFVIINEPPFDRFPGFRNKSETNATKYLYLDHNKILSEKFSQNYSSSTTKLNVRLFDSYTFISNIMDNYENYGFENLNSCWDSINNSTIQTLCSNATQRMFCDEYHLTSHMQSLVAEELNRFLLIQSTNISSSTSTSISSSTSTSTSSSRSTSTSSSRSTKLTFNLFLLLPLFFLINKI